MYVLSLPVRLRTTWTSNVIDGVTVTPLRIIADSKGSVLHMIRADSPTFLGFGEIYFSSVHFRSVKAWKRNASATAHFAVPVGEISMALFDNRPTSPTCGHLETLTVGRSQYVLVTVPPKIWYGFQGLTNPEALIVNCLDRQYDASQTDRLEYPSETVPHLWPELE